MPTFVLRDGELVEKHLAGPLLEIHAESDLPRPHFISDTMDPTRHMADGRVFTSKSQFRANTRAHGCVEIGNQRDFGRKRKFVPKLDKRQRRDDIARSISDLRNGRVKA